MPDYRTYVPGIQVFVRLETGERECVCTYMSEIEREKKRRMMEHQTDTVRVLLRSDVLLRPVMKQVPTLCMLAPRLGCPSAVSQRYRDLCPTEVVYSYVCVCVPASTAAFGTRFPRALTGGRKKKQTAATSLRPPELRRGASPLSRSGAQWHRSDRKSNFSHHHRIRFPYRP